MSSHTSIGSISQYIHKQNDLSLNQLDVIQRTLNTEYGYERERRITSLAAKVREHLKILILRLMTRSFSIQSYVITNILH